MTAGPLGRVQHVGDLIAGSDPGLNRLRTAASGAVAMASALGVEFVLAHVRGENSQSTLIAMLLGAIISMMGAMALTGSEVWPKLRVGVFFPVALGAGMVPGIAVAGHTDLMLIVFVAVMFLAVFLRRFGMAFFFYGFMIWMGYFFAAFLMASWAMLPSLILDAAIGTAWVLALSVSVLRTNPRRTLAHVQRSFGARARALAAACAALLDAYVLDDRALARARTRLHAQQTRLAETALIIEAWSADDQALPRDWSARALRRRVLDVQLCLDRMAGCASALVTGDPALKVSAATLVRSLSRRDYPAAARSADALRVAADAGCEAGATGSWIARHLAEVTEQFLDYVRQAEAPPEVDGDVEFTPAVALAMGNLPGSPAIAREVAVRGRRWNPLTRLDFTTRQAVQVAVAGALAIGFGRMLDPTRYYWAVIAAFIAFTGTGTRSETFLKASNRVLGTLVGLVAGIAFARLTAGHTGWTLVVIVGSMFFGFYLIRLSYAYMIFFITIMVAQLYSVLHEFSDQLLVLRLEETAIGAAVGIGVALLVAPLSTRDTVASSRLALLTTLADVLDAAAVRVETGRAEDDDDLDALQRGLDNRLRELQQVAAPLTRPLVWDNSPREARHKLTVLADCVRTARGITTALRNPVTAEPAIATACRALAGAARSLADRPVPLGARGVARPSGAAQLAAEADAALFAAGTAAITSADGATRRALIHLHMLLQELVDPHAGAFVDRPQLRSTATAATS